MLMDKQQQNMNVFNKFCYNFIVFMIQGNNFTSIDMEAFEESHGHSVISHTSTPGQLLTLFNSYEPLSANIEMGIIQSSPHLKLKKYKQSVYYGEYLNGKKHGKGIMLYENGRVYEGEWQCDYKHGVGFEKFGNGCVYEGDYVNGKPEGMGRYNWPNGEFYEGEWVNGLKHGSGVWNGAKGDSYSGEWKLGKADGYGVHTWINGDVYEGEFKECLKHGPGIERFVNGDIYKGSYANGKPSGFGEYYWKNGSYFKGYFRNGLREGEGLWKKGPGNSDKYEGQYNNDKKCGYGIFTWASGNMYKGRYSNDLRNGYGQMYWVDGSHYRGNWLNGAQHGEGQVYVPGQGIKKGTFQDNSLIILQYQAKQNIKTEELAEYQSVKKKSFKIGKKNSMSFEKESKDSVVQKKQSLPPKIHFRTKAFSSKNHNKTSHQSIDHDVPKYLVRSEQRQKAHPLVPRKFYKQSSGQKTKKPYSTIEPATSAKARLRYSSSKKGKDRVLHSSFYMHRLANNQTNTSEQKSRGELSNNPSAMESFGKNETLSQLGQNNMLKQMKIKLMKSKATMSSRYNRPE